jgi:hypothetical protein
VRGFCRLPGAQQISSGMLLQLLQELVVQPSNHSSTISYCIWQLPTAAGISKDDAVQLVTLACQEQSNAVVGHLSALPSVEDLEVEEILQLMLAAAEHKCRGALSMLFELKAAQQMSSEQLVQVVVLIAAQPGFVPEHFFDMIDNLPASQFSSKLMVQMLAAAAVQHDNYNCMLVIWRLQAEERLNRGHVIPLLETAIALGHNICVPEFLWFKIYGERDKIDCAQAMQLLMAGVQHGSGSCVATFIKCLSAVRQLNSTHVAELLTAAAENGSSGYLRELWKLPAAQQLSRDDFAAAGCESFDVVRLQQAAIQHQNAELVQQLCKFPAADKITCDIAATLLATAVRKRDAACAKELCKLRSAGQLDSTQVAELLTAAVENGGGGCMHALWDLPASQQLSRDALAGLLLVAANQGIASTACGERLPSLPAAAVFASVDVILLWFDAVCVVWMTHTLTD